MLNAILAEIYKNIDKRQLLSELNPRERGSYLEVTCPSCRKQGEAFIYKNGHTIICNRGNSCGISTSLWDYIQQRDKLSKQETLEKLADYAGIRLPEIGTEKGDRYRRDLSRREIIDKATKHMQEILFNEEGSETLNYLLKRGYTQEEIKEAGFGHYPKIENLKKYIGGDLSTVANNDFSIFSPKHLGETHTLMIPFKDEWGKIEGFIVRSLLKDEELKPLNIQKYILNYGLKRGGLLFNYDAATNEKKLIITEGYIDALISTLKGIKGVVATGGAKIPKEQIVQAIKRGITQFVLGLDADKTGIEGMEAAIKLINEEGGKAYVINLPQGYKDPDELLRIGDNGVNQFKEAIEKAESGAKWAAKCLLSKHGLPGKHEISDIEKESIIEEALRYMESLDPYGVKNYIEIISEGLQIPIKYFDIFQEVYNDKKNKEAKIKAHRDLIGKAGQLLKNEQIEELDKLYNEELNNIRYKETNKLLTPYSLDEFLKDVRETPEGIPTGYKMLDSYIALPQAAITLVAARPSHGKTTLLTNLLLNVVENNPDDSFYFFSYEETKAALALNMINILANKKISNNKNKEALKQYLKTGRDLNGYLIPEIEKAKQKFGELTASGRLQIFDDSLDAETLSSIIINQKKRNPRLKAVFIDYIQKIKLGGTGSSTRQVELQKVSEIIRETAVKANIPIILAAQLGRPQRSSNSSDDTKKGIRLDNLREAGDLEQDANLVLGLFNEDMNKSELSGDIVTSDEMSLKVIILKSRGYGNVGRSVSMELKGTTLKIKEKQIINEL